MVTNDYWFHTDSQDFFFIAEGEGGFNIYHTLKIFTHTIKHEWDCVTISKL